MSISWSWGTDASFCCASSLSTASSVVLAPLLDRILGRNDIFLIDMVRLELEINYQKAKCIPLGSSVYGAVLKHLPLPSTSNSTTCEA